MVDATEFLCDIYIGISPPYMHVKWFDYVAYMPNLVGVFVCGTYLAIT